MEKFTVLQYETPEGICPFKQWIDAVKETQTQARIFRYVRALSLENFSNCRPVGSGVHELKINVGPGYRIYFGNEGKTILIILCGGSKKTQAQDIKRAHLYWSQYKRHQRMQ